MYDVCVLQYCLDCFMTLRSKELQEGNFLLPIIKIYVKLISAFKSRRMMKEEEALASGNITCHEAKFEGCYYCSCYYSKAKLLLYYVCVVAAFSKFLASMALKDVVRSHYKIPFLGFF